MIQARKKPKPEQPDGFGDIVLDFRNNGIPCGFNACKDAEFIFKPSKYHAVTIPLETLKRNLRLMVKAGTARIINAGTREAVVVPRDKFNNLFI